MLEILLKAQTQKTLGKYFLKKNHTYMKKKKITDFFLKSKTKSFGKDQHFFLFFGSRTNMEEWISGNGKHGITDGARYECSRLHAELFDNLRLKTREAFNAICTAMLEQEQDMIAKLNQFQIQQAAMLTTCRPSVNGLEEFQQNVKKINDKAIVLTGHASNLTHVKLTLARLASLVSLDGQVAKLVTPAPRLQPSPQNENARQPRALSMCADFASQIGNRLEHCNNTCQRVCETVPANYPSIMDYKSPLAFEQVFLFQVRHVVFTVAKYMYKESFFSTKKCRQTMFSSLPNA